MKYLISLDWFQYCCINCAASVPEIGTTFQGAFVDQYNRTFFYNVVKPQERHTVYKDSITITSKDGTAIVHLHYNPISAGIPPEYVAAKVDNRLLYSSEWSYHLHSVLEALNLKVKNITRADICCDFQQFENGDYPTDFIKKYVMDGAGDEFSCYIRKHSNKCFPVLTKMIHTNKQKTSYFVDASQAQAMCQKAKRAGVNLNIKGIEEDEEIIKCESIWQYLRWGSRNSACSVYMYDKTREMRECKQKPYIYRQWEEVGVVDQKDENGNPLPVYRVEISLTSKAMEYKKFVFIETKKVLDKDSVYRLKWDSFALQQNLEDVYWSFAAEYFCFYKFEGQKYKKNMPIVQLFPQECLDQRTFKPVCISRTYDTGRMEKMAARTFEKVADTMLDLMPSDVDALRRVSRIMHQISAIKSSKHRRSMSQQEYLRSEMILQDVDEIENFIMDSLQRAEEEHSFEKLWNESSYMSKNQQITEGGGQNAEPQRVTNQSYYEKLKEEVQKRVQAMDIPSMLRKITAGRDSCEEVFRSSTPNGSAEQQEPFNDDYPF